MEVWGSNRAVDSAVTMTGVDVWAYSQPYRNSERGGDVFYLSSCASGRISRLLLADVSGHGSAVSEVAKSLRDLMRRHINNIDQTRFAEIVNDEFSGSDTDGRFATAIVATFFSPRRTLSISNAGHPDALIYRRKNQEWSVFGTNGEGSANRNLPLGIVAKLQYSTSSSVLNEGDLVLCYTDAFSESSTSDGRILQIAGLLDLMRDAPVEQPAELIPWLIRRLQQEDEGNLLQDDATIALITPNERSVTLRDNLLAPFRYVKDVSHRLLSR